MVSIFLGCGGGDSGSNVKISPTSESLTSVSLPDAKEYTVENLTLPECNQNNPKVQLIRTKKDWEKINSDKSKSIFCVKPGDYRDKIATVIRRSGSKESPLYLLLDNGNNSHPASLNKNLLANVNLQFENSNYWVIDRMASVNIQDVLKSPAPINFVHSSFNVVNRHFIDDTHIGIIMRDSSNNNVIQNSRLQNMSETGRKNDRSCVLLLPTKSDSKILNNKIIHNEFHNCNDGVHLLWREGLDNIDFAGTVIYDNDISIDSSIYTDCHGNLTPNGECSYSEGAIDVKSDSSDKNNPIVITKNRMWGFRKADGTNSKLADPGVAIVFHYGIRHVIVSDNIIFDSKVGILSGEKIHKNSSLYNASITSNFISDVYRSIVLSEVKVISIKDNYINRTKTAWLAIYDSEKIVAKVNFIANKLSESGVDKIESTELDISGNHYFTTTDIEDRSFITDKFSGKNNLVNPVN
jgi:hypothetical protein